MRVRRTEEVQTHLVQARARPRRRTGARAQRSGPQPEGAGPLPAPHAPTGHTRRPRTRRYGRWRCGWLHPGRNPRVTQHRHAGPATNTAPAGSRDRLREIAELLSLHPEQGSPVARRICPGRRPIPPDSILDPEIRHNRRVRLGRLHRSRQLVRCPARDGLVESWSKGVTLHHTVLHDPHCARKRNVGGIVKCDSPGVRLTNSQSPRIVGQCPGAIGGRRIAAVHKIAHWCRSIAISHPRRLECLDLDGPRHIARHSGIWRRTESLTDHLEDRELHAE